MCKFGLEITSVLSGTTCPVQVAQYDRYIQMGLNAGKLIRKHVILTRLKPALIAQDALQYAHILILTIYCIQPCVISSKRMCYSGISQLN